MTTIIIVATIILALIGILIAVWSIVDTRRKHYDDYIKRKRSD